MSEVKRSRRCASRISAELDHEGADYAEVAEKILGCPLYRAPHALEAHEQPIAAIACRSRLQAGFMDLLEQIAETIRLEETAITIRQTRRRAAVGPLDLAQQAFEQPRAVGVELAHSAHVDPDVRMTTSRFGADQSVEAAGVGRRP